MITLKDLIKYLESINLQIYGDLKDFNIDNIAFLKNCKKLSKTTLYLTNLTTSDEFKEYNILCITNNLRASCIYPQLKTTLSLDKIYILLSKFLLETQELYIKKYSILSSINNDYDINKILDIAENYLNNPIFILDTSYKILGFSKYATLIDGSINNYNDNYYLVSEIVEDMKKDNCMDSIYNSNKAFFHFTKEELIFCGIKVSNVTTAYICVLKQLRSFEDSDLSLVDTLSKTLSTQIQKDNSFINSSGLEEEYYLIDLLENKINNLNYLKERLSQTDFKIKENLFLLSIPFKQIYKDYRHNFGLKQLISSAKNILGNSITTYTDNKIVFLVSKDSEELFSLTQKVEFLKFLMLNNLKCGVSMPFKNILETKEFFKQSLSTLDIASQLKDMDYIFYFENYLEYYWFNLHSNPSYKISLHNLIHPYIKKIMINDKIHNTDLLKTLTAYLDSNRNSNIASKSLSIHNSTFFYRFHKIETLLNVSLTDSNILFKLELSLKLLKYINKSNTKY